MAEMLIDGAKLDACLDAEADAIRAKTGGSADIAFDFANNKGFADAIDSIQTGGGSPWELIADYTSDAAATIVEVTIPIGKQDYDVYKVMITVAFSDSEYPYLGVNGAYGSYESAAVPKNTTTVYEGFVLRRKTSRGGTVYKETLAAYVGTIASAGRYPFTSLNFKSYYANKINAGCNIKVWGLKE